MGGIPQGKVVKWLKGKKERSYEGMSEAFSKHVYPDLIKETVEKLKESGLEVRGDKVDNLFKTMDDMQIL
ncbi:hypothetical protein [Desulfovulcanus sp.]